MSQQEEEEEEEEEECFVSKEVSIGTPKPEK